MKVIVLTADANTLLYHRGDLIRDIAESGCEVVTSAAEDYPHVRKFMADLGGRHEPVRMVRSRVNLIRDRETWLDMFRLFRRSGQRRCLPIRSNRCCMDARLPGWQVCRRCMRCFQG